MNFDQLSDTEEEPTENTRLMSETVAMENRAYQGDSHSTGSRPSDSRHGDSRHGDHSQPAEIVPASNETVSLITLFGFYIYFSVSYINYYYCHCISFLPRNALHYIVTPCHLSICNVGGSGAHRLEIWETNCTDN